MKKLLIAACLAWFSIGTAAASAAPAQTTGSPSLPSSAEGRQYLAALIDEVRRADRIVVTEHSYAYDLVDVEAGKSLMPSETIVYGTRTLNAAQKSQLIAQLQAVNPTTQDAFPACIFEGHHTLTFIRGSRTNTKMELCFGCGEIRWSGTNVAPPWALVSGLSTFITSIGFQPKRDWQMLATEHLKRR